MPSKARAPRPLRLDRERFAQVERLAFHEITNALLLGNMELQRAFGLRAEEFQIFFLIVMTTAQRYVRGAPLDSPLIDRTPLRWEDCRAISRRRIAETLGIPAETVRRHVANLMERCLVVERGRGQIANPPGVLARLSAEGKTVHLAQQHLALTKALLKLGVLSDLRPAPEEGPPRPDS